METFEIKVTKSVILNEVLEKCKILNDNIKELKEGDLIRIDNVKLSVLNEEEHRIVKLIKSDMFKGLQIPEANGLDINNIFNSVLSDYYYQVIGKGYNNNLLFKIPVSFENEFENNYSIDDLFIGKVSLVGIYKGKIKISELKSTFQYLIKKDDTTNEKCNIISSSFDENFTKNIYDSNYQECEYEYIDILAILQIINTN